MHYNDDTMSAMASQITSFTIVYSTVYSGADQRKHQNTASLAFVRGIHRWPVNSPHRWPVTRRVSSFDDVIMWISWLYCTLCVFYLPVLNLMRPSDAYMRRYSNHHWFNVVGRSQAIIWTNAEMLLIEPLRTNFSVILIQIITFSFKKKLQKCRLRNGGHCDFFSSYYYSLLL